MGTEPTSLRLDVNLFLRQVALNNGLPFSINIPNPSTRAAMKELEDDSGIRFDNSDNFYDDLKI